MSYLGEDIKKLGFGLMRLPKKNDEIDIEQTKEMVDRFLEAGYTYFDTAWAYEGSEEAIRQALVERYPRERYQLATKNAAWLAKNRDEAVKQLETSLERTGAGYFDFYLLHNLGENRTSPFEEMDLWNFVIDMKKAGKIRHIGFSAHCNAEDLEEIIVRHPEAEFVQLQINYADWDSVDIQSGACYRVARKYNLPIVIMEPVKGGMLATPPASVEEIFRAAEPNASSASWALRYAADLEGIITVLSGMSSVEQMEDNLATMKGFTHLSQEQSTVLTNAAAALKAIPLIQCTSCNYCAKVCPMDVGISGTFTAMNSLTLYNNMAAARGRIGWLVDAHNRKHSTACVECGACEKACPQHLPIRELLKKANDIFEK